MKLTVIALALILSACVSTPNYECAAWEAHEETQTIQIGSGANYNRVDFPKVEGKHCVKWSKIGK
ncbi:hypothetical protein A7981_05765 [Methylovorus sp. MM2]|uniref:hypothetical protein n=1 Tax=Methylovorus sp. MM2 TaxID=1848038 RepID=UPI0007DFA3B8|nr:hypothetical protein [Methylovorus sp. MM2]OAM52940.1 hypothetical protein A7981_05765 [Methylovorus sp. MM2]